MSPEVRAILEDLRKLGVTVPVLPTGLLDLQERAGRVLKAGGSSTTGAHSEQPAGLQSTSTRPSRLTVLRDVLRDRRSRGGNSC